MNIEKCKIQHTNAIIIGDMMKQILILPGKTQPTFDDGQK